MVKTRTLYCYMDTDSFMFHVKVDYVYEDIAEDF